MQLPTHLGDGAYLDHDGYQFWLAVNDHRNRVVALEPGAYRAFLLATLPIAAAQMFDREQLCLLLEKIASDIRAVASPAKSDPDDDFDVLEDD